MHNLGAGNVHGGTSAEWCIWSSNAANIPKTSGHNLTLGYQFIDHKFKFYSGVTPLFNLSPTTTVSDLKEVIKTTRPNELARVDPHNLVLWRILDPLPLDDGGDATTINDLLQRFRNNQGSVTKKLNAFALVSEYFDETLPAMHLHLLVQAHISGAERRSHDSMNKIHLNESFKKYDQVFIQAEQLGVFAVEDLIENGIVPAPRIPDFVQDFNEKLSRRRGVNADYLATILQKTTLPEYFDTSPTETSRPTADETEVFHIAFLANLDATIARVFGSVRADGRRKPVKELVGNWLFFYMMTPYFESGSKAATVKLGTEPWPFRLIAQVADAYYTYRPKSDFLLPMNSLPCLIVEANSTPSGPPRDHYRVLLQGASIVRFANSFINAYSTDNSFILVAVFVEASGRVDRYLMFQFDDGDDDGGSGGGGGGSDRGGKGDEGEGGGDGGDEGDEGDNESSSSTSSSASTNKVFYALHSFDLNDWHDRLLFALEMYNLASVLRDRKGDKAEKAIKQLQKTVNNSSKYYNLASFYTGKRKRKRSGADDAGRSGRGPGPAGTAADQLEAHGYKLVQDSFDDEGGTWEPFIKLPSHVHTVYRVSDSSRTELVAKQVHEHLNELAILQYLRTIQPQSPRIISLIEAIRTSDGEWLILPKLHSILELPIHPSGAQLSHNLIQFSYDLIEGLAYLHNHGVAHLDIKPQNLVYTNHRHLQIIDLDAAVRVESEDEEIEGLRGTRGWRAPEMGDDEEEVGPPPLFSPIRADRWSCGKVLLELVGQSGTDGGVLAEFAKRLMDEDPFCRPSLIGWDHLALQGHS